MLCGAMYGHSYGSLHLQREITSYGAVELMDCECLLVLKVKGLRNSPYVEGVGCCTYLEHHFGWKIKFGEETIWALERRIILVINLVCMNKPEVSWLCSHCLFSLSFELAQSYCTFLLRLL